MPTKLLGTKKNEEKTLMVIFKIDFCLLAYSPTISIKLLPRYASSLTTIQIPGFVYPHYLIDAEYMGNIFRALETNSIPIGFLTEFDYDEDRFKIALGRSYDLQATTVANAAFIKYTDFPLADPTDWGVIAAAQQNHALPLANFCLITDNRPIPHRMLLRNLHIIQARGIPNPLFGHTKRDSSYLQEISDYLELDLFMPSSQKSLTFRKFYYQRVNPEPLYGNYSEHRSHTIYDDDNDECACFSNCFWPCLRNYY